MVDPLMEPMAVYSLDGEWDEQNDDVLFIFNPTWQPR
jgi:hypothetical protein